jgi:hypothetical protein
VSTLLDAIAVHAHSLHIQLKRLVMVDIVMARVVVRCSVLYHLNAMIIYHAQGTYVLITIACISRKCYTNVCHVETQVSYVIMVSVDHWHRHAVEGLGSVSTLLDAITAHAHSPHIQLKHRVLEGTVTELVTAMNVNPLEIATTD